MKYVFLIFFILLSGLGIYFMNNNYLMGDYEPNIEYLETFEGQNLDEIFANENFTDELKNSPQLSLVNIDIIQGSNGEKDWELKADWGTYSEGTGNLLTNYPNIIYYGKKQENIKPIYITAQKGKVLEKNKLIIIENSVYIKQDDLIITGPYSDFRPDIEIFSLSKGAEVVTKDMLAKANTMQWDVKTSILKAQGNVAIILNDDKKTFQLNSSITPPPIIER